MVRRISVLVAALLYLATASNASASEAFAEWLTELRSEARDRGISAETLQAALEGVTRDQRVIELDRRQPEFIQTFWDYLDRRITPERVETGRAMLKQHRDLLEAIRRDYGVQPRFLVAFWGLETNFGGFMGDFPTIGSLATLAYDERRGAFFRTQLLDALTILDQGHVGVAGMKGSWAGAMGHLQFMPSTFLAYAVDRDGDGRRDLWSNLHDVFASGANYLAAEGWKGDERWGREVTLPKDFDWELAGLTIRRSVAEWRELGVMRADGRPLPSAKIDGSLLLPAGHRGPAFLVYDNFRTIMAWNRSIHYAISVGHLSDRIAGAGDLLADRGSEEKPLSRQQVEELQLGLAGLGFDPGEPDGRLGRRTRAAIKAYQRKIAVPVDGFATHALLDRLRQEVVN